MRCMPSKMRYNQFWNDHSVICRLKLQRCTKRSSRIVAQVQDNCQNSVQQGRLGVRYYQTRTACTPLLFPERLCRDWYIRSHRRFYTAWPMNDLPHNICVKNLSQRSCHLFSVLTFLSFPSLYVSYSSVRSSSVIGDRCIHSCAYHHCRQYSCCCSFNAVLHNISPFIFIWYSDSPPVLSLVPLLSFDKCERQEAFAFWRCSAEFWTSQSR